jgi:hypothetical protein
VTTAPDLQPDLWIKQGANWLGDDLYNGDGTGQTGQRSVAAGKTAIYSARLYNDGSETETFTLKGPVGDANWTVQYYQGTQEVTAQVTSAGGWLRANVPSGGLRSFTVKVTPRSGMTKGSSLAVWVRAEAQRDPTQCDVIQAITQVK